jgi:hypothetical protein
MRGWFLAASLMLALMLASMSGPAGATDPGGIAAEKDARFFLAVCQNALDDLAAVSRLAAEQNWESMVDPRFPESKPPWIDGMWRVKRDDRSYTVGIGRLKAIKHCYVSFGEPGPSRDDFIAIASKSLRLTALPDSGGGASDVQFVQYRVESLFPEGSILQLVMFRGGLSEVVIFGPNREVPPPPPPLRTK